MSKMNFNWKEKHEFITDGIIGDKKFKDKIFKCTFDNWIYEIYIYKEKYKGYDPGGFNYKSRNINENIYFK